MDRRAFFKLGVRNVTTAAVDAVEARASALAKRYIRPPFAVGELDFLLKCSRCGDCIDACPHDTIFPLSARLGAQVVSTPALDLLNGACHLCEDWPCVQVCKSGALTLPEFAEEAPPSQAPPSQTIEHTSGDGGAKGQAQSGPLPLLAIAKIDTAICLPYLGPECGACGSACPVPGALTWDMSRPQINHDICTGCALCRRACITTPKAILIGAV